MKIDLESFGEFEFNSLEELVKLIDDILILCEFKMSEMSDVEAIDCGLYQQWTNLIKLYDDYCMVLEMVN